MRRVQLPPGLTITAVTPEDIPEMLTMIRELAEYEMLSHEMTASEADLHKGFCEEDSHDEAVILRFEGKPAGYATFACNFSTYRGSRGMIIEDIYIKPKLRGRQFGRALMAYLSGLALDEKCIRMKWRVIDWNKPALGFCEHIGASRLDGWLMYRLVSDGLHRLADEQD
jgi:GNAT superfamily N-acetyltransferase